MEKTIDTLIGIIEDNAENDPETRRILATATISHKFAKFVKALREDHQLTEAQLADLADCSPEVISDLENPTPDNTPRIENMVSIAEALGYKVNIELSQARSDEVLDKVRPAVYNTLINDVRRIGASYLAQPEFNTSITVVAIDSSGHVRLPDNVKVEKDADAFFHSIPIQVKTDDS